MGGERQRVKRRRGCVVVVVAKRHKIYCKETPKWKDLITTIAQYVTEAQTFGRLKQVCKKFNEVLKRFTMKIVPRIARDDLHIYLNLVKRYMYNRNITCSSMLWCTQLGLCGLVSSTGFISHLSTGTRYGHVSEFWRYDRIFNICRISHPSDPYNIIHFVESEPERHTLLLADSNFIY